MTDKETSTLRATYQRWPTEQLIRALTSEKNDYRPEAITLISEELQARGITPENTQSFLSSLPPSPLPKPERNTFFFPARLNRKQYVLRLIIWLILFLLGGVTLELLPLDQSTALIIWIILTVAYSIVAMDVPRMKSAGITPLALFFYLIPFGIIVTRIVLLVVPPKDPVST